MSSGVLQVFCLCSRRLRACRPGPRAWWKWRPGAWRSLFPDSCRSWVSGQVGQGPGRAWPAKPAPLGVLDAPGCEPIIGRRGTGAGMRLWWLRAPWAAPVLARLAAVIPPGGPRLAAAGHGAGPRGQRDQSGARPRRRGRGPDMGAITRCPRPGLLTLPPAPRDRRSGT